LVDDATLMASFCSLGGNCEFGAAQRAYGAEPIDLFRWASTLMPVLLDLLGQRFEGIGEDLEVFLTGPGGEYMVRNKRYRFNWHAWVRDGETTPERLLARERARLPRLAEFLVDAMTEGRRIFVRVPDNHVSEYGLGALVRSMRKYGPTTLFFVARADVNHLPGTVVRVSDGLMRGYIDHFADPANIMATTPSADWLVLCRKARALAPA
jgi:hypothetical protein